MLHSRGLFGAAHGVLASVRSRGMHTQMGSVRSQGMRAQLGAGPADLRQRGVSTLLRAHSKTTRGMLDVVPYPRGQQGRCRWDRYTKADYGSRRGKQQQQQSRGSGSSLLDKLTPESLVYLIIGANGIVYLVWNSAQQRRTSLGDNTLYVWMLKNFSSMWVNLREGRLWTLVTPAFSHVSTMHLAVNMFILYSFGADLVRVVGKKRFLGFYLLAGVCGNLLSTVTRGIILPRLNGDYSGVMQPAIGASTATVGITTLFACLFPKTQFMLFFVVPMPAWLATVGFIGWDMWRVLGSKNTRVDGAGHLGGAAAALGYYWFRLRPLIRRVR
ncbi:hypothetical protein GGF46_003971 [Coemansia sp. RSA 552]|nr:hypothetical protein GGF46_003971 [Coemansia sp. RSA 552]